MSDRLWQPGDAVLLRNARDHYRWVAPVRVVEDRGDFVALYLQPGTEIRRMGMADGSTTREFWRATHVIPATWGVNHVLSLVRFGDGYAIQLFWDEATWELRCWYVNFQEPLRRSARGFETMDLTLDLVIAPDLSSWEWKDEDEFAQAVAAGWYAEGELRELRALGERVLDDVARRSAPFSEPWPEWRPDPSWSPPALPADWDA